MQVLQWAEGPEIVSKSTTLAKKQDNKNIKGKEMVAFSGDGKRHKKRVEVKCEDILSVFCFVQRKDISKPWFYHTLNLRRVGVKMKKQDCGAGAAHAPSKVLPITDSQCPHNSDKIRPQKSNVVSRMKELVKWAASAKAPKSGSYGLGRMVMNFKKKATSRDHDQLSNESPKISFKWNMEASSFTIRSDAGNWITTDSEYVVLEL